jgi:hypothetical protein
MILFLLTRLSTQFSITQYHKFRMFNRKIHGIFRKDFISKRRIFFHNLDEIMSGHLFVIICGIPDISIYFITSNKKISVSQFYRVSCDGGIGFFLNSRQAERPLMISSAATSPAGTTIFQVNRVPIDFELVMESAK